MDMGYGIWDMGYGHQGTIYRGKCHHSDVDGIALDGESSYDTICNVDFYMNARCSVYVEFSASFNTIVGKRFDSNHFSGVANWTPQSSITMSSSPTSLGRQTIRQVARK
jgi:hypothetical protein